MAVHDEMQAGIIIVSGYWARYLEGIKDEQERKKALEELSKNYADALHKLEGMHGFSLAVKASQV